MGMPGVWNTCFQDIHDESSTAWPCDDDGTPASQMAGNGIQETLILGKANTLQTNRHIPATDHNRDGGMSRKKKKDARLQA